MKNFYSLEDLRCDEDFCEEFCEGCAGLRLVRNYPDEPNYDECTICYGDISNSKCLKHDAYERICAVVDDINRAIGETGSFPYDDYFRLGEF